MPCQPWLPAARAAAFWALTLTLALGLAPAVWAATAETHYGGPPAEPAEPPQAKPPLDKPAQEQLALQLFQKLAKTPTDDHEAFHRIYYVIIDRCPDTERAEVAYWRLSNLLLQAYDPPKNEEAVKLLEKFLARYPHSQGVPMIKQRLSRLYEDTGRWCQAADLYGEAAANLPPKLDEQMLGWCTAFATALENCGKKDEARKWYRKVVENDPELKTFSAQVAQERLGKLGGGK
ncbi:MAG: tetratricopeptide repeat protein [Deltaproteobacteria bacterium]|nr:tetratricopeptide repeat protein [Deltaproteobacteria bacterium]